MTSNPATLTQGATSLASGGSYERLLTPAEVGARLRIDPKTLGRWRKAGIIDAIPLPSGHYRYRESVVLAILAGVPQGGAR